MLSSRILAVLALFSLSACAAPPPYQAPAIDAGPAWAAQAAPRGDGIITGDADAIREDWWVIFRDPHLDRLVRLALAGNNALKAAQARVDEADAETGASRGALWPRVDATGSLSRGRSGPAKGDLDTVSQAGLQGSWDIDPAGGNRRRYEAALAESDAARAERDRIRSDLIADAGTHYIRLVGARRQEALTQINLRAQEDSLQATQAQRDEGQVSDLEVARARAQAEETKARLPQIAAQIANEVSTLAVLTGMKPGTLETDLVTQRTLPAVPAQVVISTPVAAIAMRPDIRVAERRLARDAALKEAASAQLFPSLSLGAFFGIGDSRNAGSFQPWNIAVNSLAPILNFGRIRSQIDAADARQRQAYFTYRETVLNGMAEVESALSAYVNEQARMQSLSAAAQNQNRARNIAYEQFREGTIDQLDLLVAEEARLNADIALAQSQAQGAENLVALYRALGWGGRATAGAVMTAPEEGMKVPGKNIRKMQPIPDR